jgi:hypothetical protein
MISRYLGPKVNSVIKLLMIVIIFGISYSFYNESYTVKTELKFVDNRYVGIRDFFQYNCQKQIRSVDFSDTQ